MKKIVLGLLGLIIALTCATAYVIYMNMPPGVIEKAVGIKKLDNRSGEFSVYQSGSFISSFKNLDDAVNFAKGFSQSYVLQKGNDKWVWDNYPQFSVYYEGEEYIFASIMEAIVYERGRQGAKIVNRANKAVIWDVYDRLPVAHMIENVPLIGQNPELPRGCEVTSLAMLLNYYGIGVSKMDLAEQIKKDTSPYSADKNGNITFGNPARGFVGDMYNKSNPGLGVYHEPIFELLKEYIGSDALNLTGANFFDLYYFLAKDKPVLVITNSTFKLLGSEAFSKWKTEDGEIQVTNYEHSVLIKGYDEDYIYFNNPLDTTGMQRAPARDFILAWEQMGRQAVTYFE